MREKSPSEVMCIFKRITRGFGHMKKGGGMKRSRDGREVGIDPIQAMKGEKKKKTVFNSTHRGFCKFDYKLSTFDLNHLPNLQQIVLLAWLHLKPQCIHPFHALPTRAHTPNNKTSVSTLFALVHRGQHATD